MDVKLISDNRRRKQQQRSRRWQYHETIMRASLSLGRGAQAALARRLGANRSTISRDVRAWWRAHWASQQAP
jgi:hypothetical protein